MLFFCFSTQAFSQSFEHKSFVQEILTQQILEQGSSSKERFSYIELLNLDLDQYIKSGFIGSYLKEILIDSKKSFEHQSLKISKETILSVLIQMIKSS
jgi:hypothetical protein